MVWCLVNKKRGQLYLYLLHNTTIYQLKIPYPVVSTFEQIIILIPAALCFMREAAEYTHSDHMRD